MNGRTRTELRLNTTPGLRDRHAASANSGARTRQDLRMQVGEPGCAAARPLQDSRRTGDFGRPHPSAGATATAERTVSRARPWPPTASQQGIDHRTVRTPK